jgi:hypothetical protein
MIVKNCTSFLKKKCFKNQTYQKLSITKNVCQNNGRQMPDEAYFQQYPKLLGQLDRSAKLFGGVSVAFSAKLLPPILALQVRCL